MEVPLNAYKESARVKITVGTEDAEVLGTFLYRQVFPARNISSKYERQVNAIFVRVPVFYPRKGNGPASYSPPDQSEMFLRHHGVRLDRGNGNALANNCGRTDEGGFALGLELAKAMDTIMCDSILPVGFLGLTGMSSDGELIRVAYRQFHARTSPSGPWLMVYVPLFETFAGMGDTANLPERYRVDIQAVKGVRLKLVSANKVFAQSDTAISVGPAHAQAIVVEVR